MKFFKYQATGNDFIIIDNTHKNIKLSEEDVKILCDRKFGVGADGLILLELESGFDYSMLYYNSDGKKSSFCGNGSRCLAHLAHKKKIFKKHASFLANGNRYQANVNNDVVSIKMQNISDIIVNQDDSVLMDSGSPHIVFFRNSVQNLDIGHLGKNIRNSVDYKEKGINVNFVEVHNQSLYVRTYERGVEKETLSCGTGVVASAIASHKKGFVNIDSIKIKTNGGVMNVSFNYSNQTYKDIFLSGTASLVFQGDVS